jgi:UDP-glucose 4-epimerase
MKILITGGYGFLGGRLALYMQQAGHQVCIGSRRSNKEPPNWLPQAEVLQINWGSEDGLAHICNGNDVVIHAAGMNAKECTNDPVGALEINGVATARLLSAAIRCKVKRFIYLSTAHVYASPLVGEITEITCTQNLHPYATSHLAGEQTVMKAGQFGEIDGVVLRLSNAFGAPAHKDVNCWDLLVNELCSQAVETGMMVLRSSGIQERDFIPITEVCRIVEMLVSKNSAIPNKYIYNLGSNFSHSVYSMAKLIQSRCKIIQGIEPSIQRSAVLPNEIHEALFYSSANIIKICGQINSNYINEIDELINFVRRYK